MISGVVHLHARDIDDECAGHARDAVLACGVNTEIVRSSTANRTRTYPVRVRLCIWTIGNVPRLSRRRRYGYSGKFTLFRISRPVFFRNLQSALGSGELVDEGFHASRSCEISRFLHQRCLYIGSPVLLLLVLNVTGRYGDMSV